LGGDSNRAKNAFALRATAIEGPFFCTER